MVRRDCGEYLQRYDADYILYSRFPDCDFMTGIYLSEYGKKNLLKQKRIAAFSTDYFVTPTIVQSFQLDIFRIEAWLRRNPEGIREQFTAEEARCDFPVHQVYRGEVELLGYDLDRPDLEVVKGVPQAVNLTFYWRKVVSSNNKYFVRTTLSNPATRQVIMEKYHLPTHDIYPMPLWNCQEIVKEHHLIWVPDAAAPGTYDIRVGLVSADELPDAKKNAKGVFSFLKELFGMDFAIFPVDESVGQDALVGKFRIRSSVLEPIRFLNKGSEW
ncbi:MAG: hypothetical protein JW950_03670 [Deltaproteobacteria bacterium]|nr:hypothetical protein [Deltaproteobacteria bacterium]